MATPITDAEPAEDCRWCHPRYGMLVSDIIHILRSESPC